MLGFAPSLDIMLSYRCLLAPLRYGAGLKGKARGPRLMALQAAPLLVLLPAWPLSRQIRMQLPPLQVVDAWWHGLPVVTTVIGGEGMHAGDAAAADEPDAAAAAPAVELGPLAFPDPAAEGFIWQLGGSLESADQPNLQAQREWRRGEEWGGLCGAASADGVVGAAALLYSDQQLWQACQRRGFELLEALYGRDRNLERVHTAVSAAQRGLEERRRHDYTGGLLWQQQLRSSEYFSRWIELKERLREKEQGPAAAAAAEPSAAPHAHNRS